MQLSALSLIPPVLTLFLVFWTRDIKKSLIAGIITAAFMAANFSPVGTLKMIAAHLAGVIELQNFLSWKSFIASERLFIFLFLIILGMIMAVMEKSGDAFAYAEFLKKRLKGKKTAQNATLLFSLSLFIDDYLNVITTSSVMPFLTDVFKIPRIKVAFLVITLAAPLCTLIPISAWGPPIAMFIANGGIDPTSPAAAIAADSFQILVKSIPFILQSILAVLCGWFIVKTGISYGTIGRHEKLAEETGNVHGGHKPNLPQANGHPNSHSLFSFLSPLIILFTAIVLLTLYTGKFWFLGGTNGFLDALSDSNMYVSLLIAATITLFYSTFVSLIKSKTTIKNTFSTYWAGIQEMGQSVIVLILALSFTEFLTDDLQTGKYIAQTLMPVLRVELLPFATFVLSTITSFSMGSSWATMTLMFPIVVPMLPELSGIAAPAAVAALPILYPLAGAVIAGSIAGSSMSPIADLLIIASNNSGVDHFDFVKGQAQYLGPLAIGSAAGFVVAGYSTQAGYGANVALSLGTALIVSFLLLTILGTFGHAPRPDSQTNGHGPECSKKS